MIVELNSHILVVRGLNIIGAYRCIFKIPTSSRNIDELEFVGVCFAYALSPQQRHHLTSTSGNILNTL